MLYHLSYTHHQEIGTAPVSPLYLGLLIGRTGLEPVLSTLKEWRLASCPTPLKLAVREKGVEPSLPGS